MSDLVKRLRVPLPYLGAESFNIERVEAADEIERLEKENARFEKLLSMVPKRPNAITYEHGWVLLDELQAIADARLALGERK